MDSFLNFFRKSEWVNIYDELEVLKVELKKANKLKAAQKIKRCKEIEDQAERIGIRSQNLLRKQSETEEDRYHKKNN